jgi:predicted nuclease of predicted toxin-antitoxin system
MKLFATLYQDEDVSALVATLLRVRGIDITTAREHNMLGKPDDEQLAYATSLERCVLTHNRVDFELLHTEYVLADKSHSGIVVATRRSPYEIARRVAVLLDSLTADEIASQLLYV